MKIYYHWVHWNVHRTLACHHSSSPPYNHSSSVSSSPSTFAWWRHCFSSALLFSLFFLFSFFSFGFGQRDRRFGKIELLLCASWNKQFIKERFRTWMSKSRKIKGKIIIQGPYFPWFLSLIWRIFNHTLPPCSIIKVLFVYALHVCNFPKIPSPF